MHKRTWISLAFGVTTGILAVQPRAFALPAVGSQAPPESLKSVNGQSVNLGDPHSARPELLTFFSPY